MKKFFLNKSSALAALMAAVVLTVSMGEVQAKRLGGGTSVGKQSGQVTRREAVPPAQNQQQVAPTKQAAPAATPAPQAAPKRPWGAILGGVAAGLGLAWLAHSLGLGEAMGQGLMIALLVGLAVAVIAYFMRRKTPSPAYAWAPAGDAPGADRLSNGSSYKPENIGNDASARPWERGHVSGEDTASGTERGGIQIGSALTGSQAWGVPAGFDTEGFLSHAKRNFVTLQQAWDRSDLDALRSMMTDPMVVEMRGQLAERDAALAGKANKTEVVSLQAQLLGIEELAEEYLASVEFSGLISEDPATGPTPFREVWNMSRAKNGSSGWLVAGIQALQ